MTADNGIGCIQHVSTLLIGSFVMPSSSAASHNHAVHPGASSPAPGIV
jgi:hypothetical protein